MLTQTKIIDAVCSIVGRHAYDARLAMSEGLLYHTDAIEWAVMVAFRIGQTDNAACDVLREALEIFDRDRLANFQNLPK